MDNETLRQLLEPTVAALGYELLDVEHRSGGNGLLRVYIDQPQGIGLDDCERVSEQVSALLDVEDPIAGHYTLEVSSPGSNRVLNKPVHFERFAGERVKVQLKLPHEGRRRYTGLLLGIEGAVITLQVDNQPVRLELDWIERAQLAPLN